MKTRYWILRYWSLIKIIATTLIFTMTGVLMGLFLHSPVIDYSTSAVLERELIANGVFDVDKCLAWAFGGDYKKICEFEFDDVWRRRHSDLFIIRGADSLVESAVRIAEAWQANKQKMYWIDDNGNKGEIFAIEADPNEPEPKIKILEGNGLRRIDFTGDPDPFKPSVTDLNRIIPTWPDYTELEKDLVIDANDYVFAYGSYAGRHIQTGVTDTLIIPKGTKIYFKDED